MNILYIYNHLNAGGITTYCLTLVREFAATPGMRVYMVSGGGKFVDTFTQAGVSHTLLPLDTSSEVNPRLWSAIPRLRRLIREEHIDIVHDQTRVNQWVSFVACLGMKVKRVYTCHGYLKRRLLRRMFPLWGEAVIAPSRFVLDHLRRDWKLSEERTYLIPHGTALEAPRDENLRSRVRAEWGVDENTLVIGGLGRWSFEKGFDVLIEAMAELAQFNERIRLVLVGQGREEARLREQTARLNLEKNILFIQGTREGQFWHGWDIFCIPSRTEGFGLTVIEAMSRRLPVVASRAGALSEIVTDGQAGLLVESGNPKALAAALKRLLSDVGLRERLAISGRLRVEKEYNIAQMASRTLSVYKRLAVGGRNA